MDSPTYPANVAYVAYKHASQASIALEHLHKEPEFKSAKVGCDWHIPRKPRKFNTSASEEIPSNLVLDKAIGSKLQ